ncbi:unnamed protein product, partial [Soboliphyme baturini]|uniref:dual-specificity kinase n=1 Tax=Soboliphyme baturini TaxID=241478 RepID=A0A183IWM0_9BILA
TVAGVGSTFGRGTNGALAFSSLLSLKQQQQQQQQQSPTTRLYATSGRGSFDILLSSTTVGTAARTGQQKLQKLQKLLPSSVTVTSSSTAAISISCAPEQPPLVPSNRSASSDSLNTDSISEGVGVSLGVGGTTTGSGSGGGGIECKCSGRHLTPDQAVRSFGNKLNAFEITEIYNYMHVYFVGPQAKKRSGTYGAPNNHGYDEENGCYLLVPHDHIAYRYEVLKVIGKGSFGQVIKAFDHKTQQYVALKVVRNEKRFHRQADEEIRILQFLRARDAHNASNTVRMLDAFTFRSHRCITFELLSINLYELIKRNKFQGFSLHLARKFAYGILQCLALLFEHRLIHCDLKPENILLRQPGRSGVKVIDFGSSCFDSQRIYTYIQSRFYRAPEVILGCKYGTAIDMWSFGCILVELLTGYPLLPGEDEADQLALMIELLGLPSDKLLVNAKRARNFFTSKGMSVDFSRSGRLVHLHV